MNDSLKFVLVLLLVVSAVGVVVEHYIEPLIFNGIFTGGILVFS